MTDEASKTRAARGPNFERLFLAGRVIDIGCGKDLVVPHAEPFDLEHGDAQRIAELRPVGAYDAVCSSHCLEHMRDVPAALRQWWALVRDGGHLILVVPDENLYEQGGWPSLFNHDHKATFRIGTGKTWSPVSYHLLELVRTLDGAEIISCERQDLGYDYALQRSHIGSVQRLLFRLQQRSRSVLSRVGARSASLERLIDRIFQQLGAPVDQTTGAALAQIQVIVRKRR